MTGPVRIGLVGAGAFGVRYLETLRRMPSVSLRWVCDTHPERLHVARTTFGVDRVTSDFREVCADQEVEAVLVVTPEALHREIAVEALSRGKHVIVEKPLATTESDARLMIEAARDSGRLLMAAFLLRFDYRYARLKERLETAGQIRSVHAWRNFDRYLFSLYSRTHSFVENAIHDIDLILWYVPSRVVSAHGFCRNTLGRENPDVNWGVLEFENGTIAVLQTNWLYPASEGSVLPQWNTGMQVMADRGVFEIANDQNGFRENSEEGIFFLDQTAWAMAHGEPRGAFGAMLRHYLACIRGAAIYVGATPADAMESMRVANMLVHSAAARKGRTPT